MYTVKKFYICKETMKSNRINDKYAVQPNRTFETILEGEGHKSCDILPSVLPPQTLNDTYSKPLEIGQIR
jgi:hypothetical protein